MAENRPEWCVADLAILTAGAITVPAYTTSTTDDLRLSAGALPTRRAVICSGPQLAKRLLPAVAASTRGRLRPLHGQPDDPGDAAGHGADLGGGAGARPRRRRRSTTPKRLAADDLACFIYTSGTGGRPKGVMLTPPQHHGQPARRLGPARADRARRRGVPVVPAAVARLRAHRRPVPADRDGRADLLRRRGRHALRQPGRGAARRS